MSRGRTPPVKDTYSTHDVAKICCVTPTTVIRWIEDGLIPAFKTVGGHRRVRRGDLEKVCKERGIPVTYALYPDEGHGFRRPENKKSFNAVAEAFLSECLGGAYQPIGDDFAGSSITVPVGADQVPGLAEALAGR